MFCSERVRDPRDLGLPRLVDGSRTRSEPRGEASCMEHDIVKLVTPKCGYYRRNGFVWFTDVGYPYLTGDSAGYRL
jgi:hypothetical protein